MHLVPGTSTGAPIEASYQATLSAWERFAWADLNAAITGAPGAPTDPQVIKAMTDAVYAAAKPLWTERAKIATDAGVEASAITAVVAQPHLNRDEAVALVLSMLHGGDPSHRQHAEQIVDDAWQIGPNSAAGDPWAVPVPPAPALPEGHMAKVLTLRPRD